MSRFTSARSSLVARELGEGPVHFVASPRFLSKYGTPSARELRSARCIGISAFETWEVYPSRLNLPAKVRRFVDAVATLVKPSSPLHSGSRRRRW